MNIIAPVTTTAKFRQNMADYFARVSEKNETIVVGHRNKPKVMIVKFPEFYNPSVSDVTNLAACSGVFDDWDSTVDNSYSRKDMIGMYS